MSFYLKKYMWLISLVAVVLCSYFVARMISNFIGLKLEQGGVLVTIPTGSQESAQTTSSPSLSPEDLAFIFERNIFNSQATGTAVAPVDTSETPPTEEIPNPTGEPVPTTLGIKLVSTFSVGNGEDSRSSTLVIPVGGKDPEVYAVGGAQSFAPDVKILKILKNRVEFNNKGRLEYIELEDFTKTGQATVVSNIEPSDGIPQPTEAPKIEAKDGNNFVIDKSEIDNALANLDRLTTQVRAVANFTNGKPDGLRLHSVRSGSIFSKLGLKRGDILKKINGMEMNMATGFQIFNQLKNETHITLEVDRKGAPQTLEYDIR